MSQVKNRESVVYSTATNLTVKASLKYTSWKQDSDVTKPDFTSGSADSTVTFSGDLDGKGVGTYVITRHPDKNNDTEYYDGHLLFEGTINGKEGAVILRENGVVKNGKIQANWVISSDTAR